MRYRVLLRGSRFTLWAIEVANGSCPVSEYLDSLEPRDRKRLMSLLNRTAEAGPPSNIEKFRKLDEEIYELKSYQDRLLCFYLEGFVLVLTHGYKKKKDKMPPDELKRAKGLRAGFVKAGVGASRGRS